MAAASAAASAAVQDTARGLATALASVLDAASVGFMGPFAREQEGSSSGDDDDDVAGFRSQDNSDGEVDGGEKADPGEHWWTTGGVPVAPAQQAEEPMMGPRAAEAEAEAEAEGEATDGEPAAAVAAAETTTTTDDDGGGGSAEKPQQRLRIAVSECLMGSGVRYDGGHCRNKFLLDVLAQHAELVQVCPEVGIGLGTPREVIRLVQATGVSRETRARGLARATGPIDFNPAAGMGRRDGKKDRGISARTAGASANHSDADRRPGNPDHLLDVEDMGDLVAPVPTDVVLLTRASHEDLTARMWVWGSRKMRELQALGVDGFVLKASSPTCGMKVSLYRTPDERGAGSRTPGLWWHMLESFWPELPLIEEGRLFNPGLREHFLTRCFSHWRFRQMAMKRETKTVQGLGAFHAEHKYLLMAHSVAAVSQCGRIVAAWKSEYTDPEPMFRDFYAAFFRGLAQPPTPGKWVNALQHMMGYLKNVVSPGEKEQVLTSLEDFRAGIVPLVVPLRLIQSLIAVHGVAYVDRQVLLAAAPRELKMHAHLNADVHTATV
jgi:uncharacterized protein YbgA (DUF1722 family)/uncharacterized protein YbbK (DUF523 family)